jgi:hypothetical protein
MMSGLEVLGAVAAGVGLAQTCVDSARRISACYWDTKVSETILNECEVIIKEVEAKLFHMIPDNRAAAQELQTTLNTIRSQIEKQKKRKRLSKWLGKVGLTVYSLEYKETMVRALHTYQTRTILVGTGAIEEIRKRVGSGGIPEDVNRLLLPVVQNLVNPEPHRLMH